MNLKEKSKKKNRFNIEPRLKLWLEAKGEVVFGQGRLKLLQEIEKQGSILKAAQALSMSYRAAWGKIKASEERLGQKLLVITKGGSQGGGATLTPFAKQLMKDYQTFAKKTLTTTDTNFKQIFKNKK